MYRLPPGRAWWPAAGAPLEGLDVWFMAAPRDSLSDLPFGGATGALKEGRVAGKAKEQEERDG